MKSLSSAHELPMKRENMRITSLLIASLLFVTTNASTALISWTPKDAMNINIPSDIQVSPDSRSILFVVKTPDVEKKQWVPQIYLGSTRNTPPEPLLNTFTPAQQPRWSPDGKWVAYISRSSKTHNLCMVSVEDIHPISLTLGTKNVQTFSWSPDGKTIAFVMEDETNHVSPVGNKEKASVNRLWTIEAFSQNPIPKPWTSDEYCVRGFGDLGSMYTEFDWSPDGTKIAFAHSPSSEFDSFCLDSSIAILDLSTGNIIPWEKHSLYEASPRYSPDGEHIAYIITTSSRRYGGSKRIAIRTENGQKENLLANTSDESPHLLGWTENGTHLIICDIHLLENYL
jgi:Tol biopolymer transport system component